ncbi:hypothetical protein FOZ61_007436 [Perkinsus olseni]|uniref:Uncharacterized protein n=1 Tax=Perkinsus olseni TaxID=32597 RepID=A0A7J6LMS4_PEROL|nr:hypothetical protein FOZ61_007436 [Perkinsus olseni]KAF4660568.1 hypothetical protein FOL46_006079 [Perkinsus olseni]
MPLSSLLKESLPDSVDKIQLSHITGFVTKRHVAALAVWKRENFHRVWMKYAVTYDSILQLENKAPSADPATRKTQKNNMIRAVCQDTVLQGYLPI